VDVALPAGRWKDDLGEVHAGPKVLHLKDVPLDRLAYFERLDLEVSPTQNQQSAVR
jgi:hypothetical protein